jgi:hypothetical protein
MNEALQVPNDSGRLFREAWIAGVRQHFPGDPKPGYVSAWEDMPDWEQASASAVFEQVAEFVRTSDGKTAMLTREQRSRFVAICWTAQIYKHIPEPKPAYVADWADLPEWQQQTDADIFDHIEELTVVAHHPGSTANPS